MITKHYYRVDEVQAALLYAIHKGRPVEAAFWCEELIVTELWAQAWATLTQAWLFFALATDPTWITDRMCGDDAGQLHEACYRLCVAKKDNSLWYVLLGAKPDTITRRIPSVPCDSPLDQYLCAAICQGKGSSAWWAAEQMGLEAADPRLPACSLSPLMKSVGLTGPPWDRVCFCATVLLACCADNEWSEVLPAAMERELAKWRAMKGVRARRLYAVYPECLYGLTERGCMSREMSTVEEGRRIDDLVIGGGGGAFWNFQGDIDEFYARFFPDDIPDEWSAADVRKSHGPGVLRSGEEPTLTRLGRLWMTDESVFAWGCYEIASGLEGREFGDAGRGGVTHGAPNLRPQHKQLTIV
jgi:hypothetical protein